MKAGDLLMRTRVLQEKNYAERMQNGVEPYLAAHAEEFYWERESGHPIHVLRYRAFRPRGVVAVSYTHLTLPTIRLV